MKDIGIDKVEEFEFVDPPSREAFHEAHETLIALGAIQRGSHGLTDIGKMMAGLPLEPRIARMIIEAEKHGCTKDVATIAAFLSGRQVFARPKGKEIQADRAHVALKNPASDALTFLRVWDKYEDSDFDNQWCYDNFLNARVLREVDDIRYQLFNILESYGFEPTESSDTAVIAKAVAMGLAYSLLEHRSRHSYGGVLRQIDDVFIHPGSAIFGLSNSRWIVASEVVRTTKTYARGCTEVKPEWLPDMAPQHFKRGEPVVARYLKGAESAVISKAVLDGYGHELGSSEESVPVAEAIAIQKARVRDAESKGLLKLTFHNEASGRYSFTASFVAEAGGKRYKASYHAKVEEGVPYYCKVVDTYLGQTTVEPVFQVFAFNNPAPSPGKPLSSVEELAQKRGASLGRQ